jgi:hypothetical protein
LFIHLIYSFAKKKGNISRPHKAFISRKPGEDYNVPATDIQEIQYSDPRGILKCHILDLSQFKVQTSLPGFRAHIHFYASFLDNAPIVGLSFGFYNSRFGPDAANITYGLVNHVAYGSVLMQEGPDYTMYSWNGASMPIANDKKGELTILNFDISTEVMFLFVCFCLFVFVCLFLFVYFLFSF